ncbi:MAG: hypothetical protein HYT87_14730 [Nitrospirae bacterium]|nr:hypothetical protein [Nitrospirota bacterium]
MSKDELGQAATAGATAGAPAERDGRRKDRITPLIVVPEAERKGSGGARRQEQVFQEGWLVAASIGYYRGQESVSPEDLGLEWKGVPDYIRDLGHVRVLPEGALRPLTRVEGDTRRQVGGLSLRFPLTHARYVPVRAIPMLETAVEECEKRFWAGIEVFASGLPGYREEMIPVFRKGAEVILVERASLIAEKEGFVERYVERMEKLFPTAEVIEKRAWFKIDMFQVQIPSRMVVDRLIEEGTLTGLGEQISQRLQGSLMKLDFFTKSMEIQLAARTMGIVRRITGAARRGQGVGRRDTMRLLEKADRLDVLNAPGLEAVRRVIEVVRGRADGTRLVRNVVREMSEALVEEEAWLGMKLGGVEDLPSFLRDDVVSEVRSVLGEVEEDGEEGGKTSAAVGGAEEEGDDEGSAEGEHVANESEGTLEETGGGGSNGEWGAGDGARGE